MHSFFYVSHLYVFLSSLRLTWLTDPALVTSVYPNQMQYTPRVLQEVSLLDGVDASVRGNGRRFSKISSYPPCYYVRIPKESRHCQERKVGGSEARLADSY